MTGIACITHFINGQFIHSTPTPALTAPSGDGVYQTDGSPPIGTFKWDKPRDVNGYMHITIALALPKDGTLVDIPKGHDIAVAVNLAFSTITLNCMLQFDHVPFTNPDCADITICFDPGTDVTFVQNPTAMWYTYYPNTKPAGKFSSVANLKYLYALQNGPNFANDIHEVMRHEFRHGIGSVHTTNTNDIMFPFYHEQRRPSSMDIYQEQFSYGPRIPPVNPIEVDGFYSSDAQNLLFT